MSTYKHTQFPRYETYLKINIIFLYDIFVIVSLLSNIIVFTNEIMLLFSLFFNLLGDCYGLGPKSSCVRSLVFSVVVLDGGGPLGNRE